MSNPPVHWCQITINLYTFCRDNPLFLMPKQCTLNAIYQLEPLSFFIRNFSLHSIEWITNHLHCLNVYDKAIITFRGNFRTFSRKFLGKLQTKNKRTSLRLYVNVKEDVYNTHIHHVHLELTSYHFSTNIAKFSTASLFQN